MTLPRFDPIGALAVLALLLALALSPGDALIGMALAACWLAFPRDPWTADPAGRGL